MKHIAAWMVLAVTVGCVGGFLAVLIWHFPIGAAIFAWILALCWATGVVDEYPRDPRS